MTAPEQPPQFVPALAGDDGAFTRKLGALVLGVVRATAPAEVYVVRIDNWFGWRWFGFAGKHQGNCDWHDRKRLRIPPFVPKRVVSETLLARSADGDTYAQAASPAPLHKAQYSRENLDRWVSRLLPKAALFWVSGDSEKSGRGCVMAHVPIEGSHVAWYAGLVRDDTWRYTEKIEITNAMLAQYEKIGGGNASLHQRTPQERP